MIQQNSPEQRKRAIRRKNIAYLLHILCLVNFVVLAIDRWGLVSQISFTVFFVLVLLCSIVLINSL